MRTGIVLSQTGGVLPDMLRPFKLGVGGKIADGQQYLSWIHLDDVVRAIMWLMERSDVRGPVNLVSPNPVTNAEFTRVASEVLQKPALVPVPGFALKLLFGEMASETILASQRAVPRVLSEGGFVFEKPELRNAMSS